MAFDATSDPLVTVALSAGVGALAATAALAVSIVVARLRLIYRTSVERRVAVRWNPLVAQCAESVPLALPRVSGRELEAFLILWCRGLESLRGQAQENLRELARRLAIEPRLEKLLGSGRLRMQLLAVLCLGHLRSRDAIPMLLTLVREAPSVISQIAARALLRIDAELALPHVLEAIASRDDWSLARIVPAFGECDPAKVDPVLAAAIGTELAKERRGIRAGGTARLLRLHVAASGPAYREALLQVLAHAESASALIAALAAISHPEDIEHARRFLGHAHWPVRAAAARTLGRLGAAQDFAGLREALADRHRWVRHRAAEALCALPGADRAQLAALANGGLSDRFAADMLRQVLAEGATP